MKRRIGIGLAAALLVTCPTTWATEAQSIEIKVEDIASLTKYPKVALIGYAISGQDGYPSGPAGAGRDTDAAHA